MTNDLATQLRTYGRQVEAHLAASPAETPATARVLVEVAPVESQHRLLPSSARVGALVAIVVVVVITSLWFLVRRSEQRPADTPTRIVPTNVSNGWVAFSAGDASGEEDLFMVREGEAARRIAGSDIDGVEQGCPAFSPDGQRLAYGQAEGNQDDGYENAALVIADLTADAVLSATSTVAVDDISLPPCAIWSADGRWVAFGAGRHNRQAEPQYVDEVWLVDTETDDVRRLSGLRVSDIEWAPDATELFIASDGISVYSVATGETRPVGDVSGVESFAVSPDGQSIAFQRRRPFDQATETTLPPNVLGPGRKEWALWLMDADGTGERILAAEFGSAHGIGPVWSPDGDHIAYQSRCDVMPPPDNGFCREREEVVVVTVSENDPLEPAGTQRVIPPPQTTEPTAEGPWYPFNVTWSPDGTTLLYLAFMDGGPNSVVAVRVDGETPPVVLSGALDVSVYSGYPWLPFQSWSRLP